MNSARASRWSNVRSGQPNQAYTIVPINLTASLKLDDVSLDNFLGGCLRGYSEFFFRGEYEQIVHGPENHLRGLHGRSPLQFRAAGLEDHSLRRRRRRLRFRRFQSRTAAVWARTSTSPSKPAPAPNITSPTTSSCASASTISTFPTPGFPSPRIPNHPIDALGPKLSFGYSF